MNKKNLMIVLGIFFVIFLFIIFYSNDDDVDDAFSDGNEDPNLELDVDSIVEMSSSGFLPNIVNINQGDSVKFISVDSGSYWPSSNLHPTHTDYPGSGIWKCNSYEKNDIFDSCRDIVSGESYSFTFNEIGTWNYHDHKNPSIVGVIVVS